MLTTTKYLMTVYGMFEGNNLSTSEFEMVGKIMIAFDCLVILGSHLMVVGIFVLLSGTVKHLKEIEQGTVNHDKGGAGRTKKIVPFRATPNTQLTLKKRRPSRAAKARERLVDLLPVDQRETFENVSLHEKEKEKEKEEKEQKANIGGILFGGGIGNCVPVSTAIAEPSTLPLDASSVFTDDGTPPSSDLLASGEVRTPQNKNQGFRFAGLPAVSPHQNKNQGIAPSSSSSSNI